MGRVSFRVALQLLVDIWVRLLVDAASHQVPSGTEEHARRLGMAMGGELLTFVWLLLAHRRFGLGGGDRLNLSLFKDLN
ncbi:hypothetical protein E2562_002059 [Oryza meyeriana var. granulata]|uniref:DUF4220 domain-containing protein n=1 Tax=Oryza meyeriana var. granulata TaxID=110450 RepID=A0A6G1EDI3_9ORYZ|nr:hypothetical protein E2562_002059 [Oryza meyeriana var. granulata]